MIEAHQTPDVWKSKARSAASAFDRRIVGAARQQMCVRANFQWKYQALPGQLSVEINTKNSVGWITALADPRIGKALRLLHADVAQRWTVPMMASEVGMSRSAFTQRFTERVGRPPLDYLIRWRMVLAQRKLNAGDTVAEVAAAVGYNSQSAFSHAFKRKFGRTPRADG